MSKSSVAKNRDFRKYSKVSDEDWDWFVEQKHCVQQLWGECMKAEKFGESFNEVETRLSENSFYAAKKVLDGTFFEFQPIQRLTSNGRHKIKGWKVRNLHGSNIDEYWKSADPFVPQNLGEESAITSKTAEASSTAKFTVNYHKNSGELPQNLGEETPVALDTTAFDSSLLYSYNLSTIYEEKNEENEDLLANDRSSRLELDFSAKASKSVPSPDAQMTSKEYPELQRIYPVERSEQKTDQLTNLPVFNKRDIDKSLVIPMEDEAALLDYEDIGSVETIIYAAPPSPEDPPESPPSHEVAQPTQSEPQPRRSLLNPPQEVVEDELVRIYLLAKDRVREVGLMPNNGFARLQRFKEELGKERLVPVAKAFEEKLGQIKLPDEVLLSDYLFYDPEVFDEPQACVSRVSGLELIPWSQI